MNVFYKYTRQSLRKNKSRTLVTIIGIVLSMALLTAVIEGAYSGLQFLIRGEEDINGRYHGLAVDLDADALQTLEDTREITETNVWRQVGWAEIADAQSATPYLLIQDVSDGVSLAAVQILEGRMPENDRELLLPEHFLRNDAQAYQVGDVLELDVGQRLVDGVPARQNDSYYFGHEMLSDPVETRYTVVGIYSRLSFEIEPYECPGYMALTLGGGRGSYTALFRLAHPNRAYAVFQTLSAALGHVQGHNYLLAFYGSLRGTSLTRVLYGFAAILVLLIAFGSISLIYNSFSISVSERTRQFGILKSVGATKKQIRASVLYEALVLSAIAIPIGLIVGCVGIGLTLYFLRDGFRVLINSGSNVQMQLVLNPGALGIAALVCLSTTLISAWIPARRAVKITPMQAIRQSEDVKLTKKDVRAPKLAGKLFGFSGTMAAKNFRRNRRRYRATVISLFLSVVLFIAASSFCAYLTDAVNTSLNEGTMEYELWWGNVEPADAQEAEQRYTRLAQNEHILTGTYYAGTGGQFFVDRALMTDAALDSIYSAVDSGQVGYEMLIQFVRDQDFAALCSENGRNAADFLDPAHPMALLKNQVNTRYYTEGGVHFESYALLTGKALPAEVTYENIRYVIDGWQLQEDDGETYWYYSEDYLREFWKEGNGSDTLDRSQAMALPRSEAVSSESFTVGAVLQQLPYWLSGENRAVLIYPYSLFETVLSAQLQSQSITNYVFQTSDHSLAFAELSQTIRDMGMSADQLYDYAESAQSERMIVTIVDVFSYGFIILISLIAAANVFNTVSTSISLRRRELAMLESIGLGKRDFYRMMDYECLIYGSRSLIWGLPAAILVTYGIYKVVGGAFNRSFYLPWYSVVIAVGSVFLVVFATMLYAAGKLRKENLIDALKLETL